MKPFGFGKEEEVGVGEALVCDELTDVVLRIQPSAVAAIRIRMRIIRVAGIYM